MTIKTESKHGEEFLISEANGYQSRKNITVKSGQNLKAGQVVRDNSGIEVYDAEGEQAVGVLLRAVDASDAAKDGVIIERDAEVDGDLLEWGDSNEAAITAGIADLEALNIRVR